MGIFDFIKRKKKEDFDLDEYTDNSSVTEELNNRENELATPSKELFTASETELKTTKNMENNTSLIQKIITEINLFCSRDLESKGFKDCMENSDMLNKEMNRKLIFADFKILIETSTGQGSELCYNLDDLAKFYKKIKICSQTI
mgnify:CR=1 FL=1